MNIWLDDERPAPEGWVHVYTSAEAIEYLTTNCVEEISLDHDLGDSLECGTGYDVVLWIEEQVATNGMNPPLMHIHSANSVGREKMQSGIANIYRLSKKA